MTDIHPVIRRAGERDIPQLRQIWKTIFHDDDEYLDMFFSRRFADSHTLVAELDGKLISSAYMFPMLLWEGNQRHDVMFGYSGGVLPEYRRLGICSRLVRSILAECESSGARFLANPANETAVRFFASLGLTMTVYKKRLIIPAQRGPVPELEPMEAEEYTRLRNAYFGRDGFYEWDTDSVAYALEENRFCGGFSGSFERRGVPCALMGTVSGQQLHIRELMAPPESIVNLSAALAYSRDAREAVVDLPVYCQFSGELVPVGVTAGTAPPPNSYWNLYWE